jgi:hypothetical protein
MKFGTVPTVWCVLLYILFHGRHKSKNDANEAVSVVSLTPISGGYINGRNSANLELLIDKTSSTPNEVWNSSNSVVCFALYFISW